MQEWLPYVLLLSVVALAGHAMVRMNRRLRKKKRQLKAFEVEEERMFTFLRKLSEAITAESTHGTLHRMIVDGIDEVVGASGGAIYLLDDKGENLRPEYLSEGCPPLIGVPHEVMKKTERDPRALDSFLRLTSTSAEQGIFGEVLARGEPVFHPKLRSHPSFSDAFQGFGADRDLGVMIAPVRHGGKDLGVIAATRTDDEAPFNLNDFSVFRSAAEQSSFALGNALVYREANEKRRIEGDLRNASEVQRVLLPQGSPVIPGYRVHGANLPARIISGDYYDHLELGGDLHGLAIADVSGKGVAAGLLMAMCRSVLRSKAEGRDDPAAVLGSVNRQLFPDIREDMFISLYYAVILGDTGRIRIARAGHDAALLYRAGSRSVEVVRPPGLALGVDEGDVFERVTNSHELELETGDCLLFYTDGVKEAENSEGVELGMERMTETFRESAQFGAESAVTGIQRELAKFTGEAKQMDDVTLLALERR